MSAPIVLRRMESFHVAGHRIALRDRPARQGAGVGFNATEARPEKVKGLVALEPAVGGAEPARIAGIPPLALYADFTEQVPMGRWPKMLANARRYYVAIREAGGAPEEVHLPELGVRGNSHMLMMDDNHAEVLDLVERWLVAKGLWL